MEAIKRAFAFFRPAFSFERVVCRLLSAWCTFIAFSLLGEGRFTELAFMQALPLCLFLLSLLAIFLLYTVISALLRQLEADSILLLIGATFCIFLWIPTANRFLFTAAALCAYAFFFMYAWHKNRELLRKLTLSPRAAVIIAACFAVLSGTVIAAITTLRYLTFSAPNFDFGLFCNMFHYMKETGLPLVTSERDGLLSHFAVHISPIYYLLLPFYFIFPSPITLQIGQAAVLSLGIIPILLLCRHYKLSPKVTVLISFLYAFYPALAAGCYYDLHENCFLTPLLLFTFCFYERRQWIPFGISAFLVLMVKEDAAIYLVVLALYILLSNRRQWIAGLSLLLGAIAYFALALYLLRTYGEGAMINRFDNLIFDPESGLLGALKTALYNPGYLLSQLLTDAGGGWGKILYLCQLLLPLAALPFCTRKPSRWLLSAPLLINLLSMYQYQYDIGFQYSFGITSFLFYAVIGNLAEGDGKKAGRFLPFAAIACLCLYIGSAFPQLGTYAGMWKDNREDYRQMEEVLDSLPPDASLSVSTMLLSHVADREIVYEIDYHGNGADIDYVVFDLRYTSQADLQSRAAAYYRMGYTEYDELEGLLLILERGK